MVNKFGFISIFVLVGFVYCDESQELGSLSAKPQYTDLMLVLRWPATFCKSTSCTQIPDRFTIHGLWPQKPGAPGSDQLTDAILDSRRLQLLEYWPDLTTDNFQRSKRFWRNEYRKHGRYCTSRFSAEEYLVKSLQLGEAFKIRAYLAKQSILPDKSHQYDRAAIVNAIHSHTSTTPDIQCEIIGSHSYLLEVRLCMDHDLEKFVNCQGRVGSCGTHIHYPPSPFHVTKQTSNEILQTEEDVASLTEAI